MKLNQIKKNTSLRIRKIVRTRTLNGPETTMFMMMKMMMIMMVMMIWSPTVCFFFVGPPAVSLSLELLSPR